MPVTIKVRKNGPYLVEGEFTLTDHEGNVIPTPQGKGVALCRCGGSTTKPFCDGTHSKIGFKGAEEAQREFDEKA
jgi:3-phenylpropionate/trans-cinnamate dioxygenase ferredoxin subunit